MYVKIYLGEVRGGMGLTDRQKHSGFFFCFLFFADSFGVYNTESRLLKGFASLDLGFVEGVRMNRWWVCRLFCANPLQVINLSKALTADCLVQHSNTPLVCGFP